MSNVIAEVACRGQEAVSAAKSVEVAAKSGQSSIERPSQSVGMVSEIVSDVENEIQSFVQRTE